MTKTMSRHLWLHRIRLRPLVVSTLFMLIACSFTLVVQKALADTGTGSISLTTAGSPVTENFDTLSNTAGSTTNTALPTGWYITEGGGAGRSKREQDRGKRRRRPTPA